MTTKYDAQAGGTFQITINGFRHPTYKTKKYDEQTCFSFQIAITVCQYLTRQQNMMQRPVVVFKMQ